MDVRNKMQKYEGEIPIEWIILNASLFQKYKIHRQY